MSEQTFEVLWIIFAVVLLTGIVCSVCWDEWRDRTQPKVLDDAG